jgi:hypothetical protein
LKIERVFGFFLEAGVNPVSVIEPRVFVLHRTSPFFGIVDATPHRQEPPSLTNVLIVRTPTATRCWIPVEHGQNAIDPPIGLAEHIKAMEVFVEFHS